MTPIEKNARRLVGVLAEFFPVSFAIPPRKNARIFKVGPLYLSAAASEVLGTACGDERRALLARSGHAG
jgi:hypothetical protein